MLKLCLQFINFKKSGKFTPKNSRIFYFTISYVKSQTNCKQKQVKNSTRRHQQSFISVTIHNSFGRFIFGLFFINFIGMFEYGIAWCHQWLQPTCMADTRHYRRKEINKIEPSFISKKNILGLLDFLGQRLISNKCNKKRPCTRVKTYLLLSSLRALKQRY